MSVTGVLSYFAFLLILAVWAVGWLAIASLVGALLKVSPKISVTAGLILGPLGVLYVLFAGVSDRKVKGMLRSDMGTTIPQMSANEDPFR